MNSASGESKGTFGGSCGSLLVLGVRPPEPLIPWAEEEAPHNTALLPLIFQNGCWVLHLNLQQRFQFRLQPALLKNIPLSHPAPTLARLYCYFTDWCLTEVFVGFLCVYSPNPSLVPWKRGFMLFSPPPPWPGTEFGTQWAILCIYGKGGGEREFLSLVSP